MNYFQKYIKYKSKYLNLKNNISNKTSTNYNNSLIGGGSTGKNDGGSTGKIQIYLFKAEWCPHCVAFKSTWEKLQKDLKGKYEFITLDSDKDKKIIEKWDIKGYPTIIKKNGESAKEYVGPRDEESLKQFINEDN